MNYNVNNTAINLVYIRNSVAHAFQGYQELNSAQVLLSTQDKHFLTLTQHYLENGMHNIL